MNVYGLKKITAITLTRLQMGTEGLDRGFLCALIKYLQ